MGIEDDQGGEREGDTDNSISLVGLDDTALVKGVIRGQHTNAKKSCDMYIPSGVPIYHQYLGHA